MFFVPHDPYGLINLTGQERLVERVIDYCFNDTWFNDYQYHYPYLLYYAGAANEAQKIIRNIWVPLFKEEVLYEGVKPKPPHNGWKTHYTSNAGWLICSMLGPSLRLIKVELTAMKNAGFHRYTFGQSEQAHVLIDLASSARSTAVIEAHVEIQDNRRITGWQKCKTGFTVFFQAEFSKPFSSFGMWKDGAIHLGSSTQSGHPIGAFVDYSTSERETVLAKVGISLVDSLSANAFTVRVQPGITCGLYPMT